MNAVLGAAGVAGPVRFELPFDIDSAGRLTRGTLLVTDEALVAVAGGRAQATALDRVTAIEVDALTYGGRVIARTDRGATVVVQYSARLAPRYREVARALGSFLHRRGEAARPVSAPRLRPAGAGSGAPGAGLDPRPDQAVPDNRCVWCCCCTWWAPPPP